MDGEWRPPVVPGYEVGDVLGAGGMGVVWRARRVADDAPAALKIMNVGTVDRAVVVPRFVREFEVLSTLADPGLPRVFGRGVLATSGDPWVAMELLEGCTLDDHADYGGLGADELERVARSLLATLALVHGKGIVHRDIKPGNVFLTGDGRVVLLDFGLAFLDEGTRLTATGNVAGTVSTMAPEQLAGGVPTARTDLWGLGATLTLAAAGRSPCSLDVLLALARRDPEGVVPSLAVSRPDLPEGFVRLVDLCCAPDPEDRPGSAEEAVGLLEWASDRSVRSPRPRRSRPLRGRTTAALPPVRAGRRRPLAVIVAVVVIAVLILWVGGSPRGENGRDGPVDRETLVRHLLGGPWPPSPEAGLASLAGSVEASGGVPGAWRSRPGAAEAAALELLAREARRRGMRGRSWAVSASLLERHGELVALLDRPNLLDLCVADAEAAGDRAGLVSRLRALRERCPGTAAARVTVSLAEALLEGYRIEHVDTASGLESSGVDVDSRLTESFDLLRPLVFAASPADVTTRTLEAWIKVLDWSNAPSTKRAHVALASVWSGAPASPARDATMLRLYEGADEILWASDGGPGGDSAAADFETALAHLGRAVDLAGPGRPMRSRRILLRQARMLIEMDRRDDARAVYAKAQAIPLVPDASDEGFDPEEHLAADVAVARRLGLTEVALTRLRALTELDLPDARRCGHLRDLAVFCAKRGMLPEALAAADRALPLTTDPERHRELVEMRRLWKMGDTLLFGGE